MSRRPLPFHLFSGIFVGYYPLKSYVPRESERKWKKGERWGRAQIMLTKNYFPALSLSPSLIHHREISSTIRAQHRYHFTQLKPLRTHVCICSIHVYFSIFWNTHSSSPLTHIFHLIFRNKFSLFCIICLWRWWWCGKCVLVDGCVGSGGLIKRVRIAKKFISSRISTLFFSCIFPVFLLSLLLTCIYAHTYSLFPVISFSFFQHYFVWPTSLEFSSIISSSSLNSRLVIQRFILNF